MRGSLSSSGIRIGLSRVMGGVSPDTVITETDVEFNENIIITFSEAVDPLTVTNVGDGSGSMEFSDSGGWIAGVLSTSDNIQYSFNPTANLTIGNQVTATLTSAIESAVGGVPYAGPYTFLFNPVDTTAPSAPVISLSALGTTTATISLDTASIDPGRGNLTNYNVYVDTVLYASGVTISEGGTYQLTGLTEDVQVGITLKGEDPVGLESDASNNVNATPNNDIFINGDFEDNNFVADATTGWLSSPSTGVTEFVTSPVDGGTYACRVYAGNASAVPIIAQIIPAARIDRLADFAGRFYLKSADNNAAYNSSNVTVYLSIQARNSSDSNLPQTYSRIELYGDGSTTSSEKTYRLDYAKDTWHTLTIDLKQWITDELTSNVWADVDNVVFRVIAFTSSAVDNIGIVVDNF